LLCARYLGVLDATADFTTGKAEVWVNTAWGNAGFNLDRVRASLAEMGYSIEAVEAAGGGINEEAGKKAEEATTTTTKTTATKAPHTKADGREDIKEL
jgi:hypothetical protein